ncbi:MAG TPA: hypothetical protein VM282_05305 [Acidimicrobiales bacterium]|nr:hypothetical protein [Acidimicrobiales bacterium]
MRTTTACLRPALIIYGSIAIVLFAFVAFFANPDLPLPYRQEVMPADYSGPSLLEGWVRYDAGWYRSIAEHGYFFRGDQQQSSVAFFPVYALVMRAFHSVFGGDTAAWGIFITFVAGLTVSVLFYRWCVPRLGERGAQYALAVLLLWPYSWYLFGAVYADALFIALVIGAFSLLERDRVVLSTMVGAIATATRPVGVAVVIGLFVRELERRGVFSLPRFDRVRVGRLGPSPPVAVEPWMKLPWLRFDRAAFRQRCLLPLFSVVGLASYMVYLAWKFGEPFAFAIAERAPGWDLKPGPHTWFKVEFFDRVRHFPYKDGWYTWDGWYTLGIVFQVVLAIGLLLLTRRVGRKLGWGYAVYVVVVLAIPLVGSKDFQGIGRYALAAFPAFAVSGQWLATHPRLAIGPLAVSAAALGLLCCGYARGAYVA